MPTETTKVEEFQSVISKTWEILNRLFHPLLIKNGFG